MNMSSSIEDAINSILAPAVKLRGYFRPSFEQVFVSEKFFISIHYDPRESMSIRIGYHSQHVSPQLIRSRDIDEYSNGIFYSTAMESASISPTEFIRACGDYESGGIRAPNFERAFRLVASSLPEVERHLKTNIRTAGSALFNC